MLALQCVFLLGAVFALSLPPARFTADRATIESESWKIDNNVELLSNADALQSVLTSSSNRHKGAEIRDDHGWVYYVDIQLGTPPQTFSAAIDIGWSDMLVPSVRCIDTVCGQHNLYNSSDSNTSQPNGTSVQLHYGGYYSSGYSTTDTLRVGGLTIVNQSFEEATRLRPIPFWNDIYDSVLGLPRRPTVDLESSLGATSALQNIVSQKVLEKNLFSLKLSDSTVDRRGELEFGSVNESWYSGELHSFPVTDAQSSTPEFEAFLAPGWQVATHSLSFGFKNDQPIADFNLSGYVAAFSTGYARMVLPERIAMPILDYLGADYGNLVDCDRRDTMPDLVINLGSGQGVPFVLKPHDYIRADPQLRAPGEEDKCRVQFFAIPESKDETPFIVLGSVFLARWFSVFDYDKATVSLATLKA